MERPVGGRKRTNPLKYTLDEGRFSPTTPPDDDTPKITESNDQDSESEPSSGSTCSVPWPTAGLAASFQVIANTMLRMELAEQEMMKKREADRLQAQMRRDQLEDEMTRMMLQTESQIASFVHQNITNRKRKKVQP